MYVCLCICACMAYMYSLQVIPVINSGDYCDYVSIVVITVNYNGDY